MRTMIDLGSRRGPLYVIDSATSVDCARAVPLRRSFRSLLECIVPTCCASAAAADDDLRSSSPSSSGSSTPTAPSSSVVTGTFFGHRKGRVSFCLQEDSRAAASAASPLLLLEFAVPTAYLAREMESGILRIALECDRRSPRAAAAGPLFAVPVWSMYCNGRKVGFAVRRHVTPCDQAVLKLMQSVSVGAGVLPVATNSDDGELLYLRARFQRVSGSADSESFHMMNPGGSSGQELSIFLLRS